MQGEETVTNKSCIIHVVEQKMDTENTKVKLVKSKRLIPFLHAGEYMLKFPTASSKYFLNTRKAIPYVIQRKRRTMKKIDSFSLILTLLDNSISQM